MKSMHPSLSFKKKECLNNQHPHGKPLHLTEKDLLPDHEIQKRIEIGRKLLADELGDEEIEFIIDTSREKLKSLLWNV